MIRNFTTGMISADSFVPLDNSSELEGVVKKALVAVEGSFKDSSGRPHEFTPDSLSKIAGFTAKALEMGTVIPVCTDHVKTVENTVGSVDGNVYTKVITESDLPNPKAAHLVGKVGLFMDNVTIKAKEVAEKVRNGIVSSVSMGLNLDPSDNRIIELSLVPIPAINHMGLFKFGDEANVFTWEELETNAQTIEDLKEEYDKLTENLWKLLNNIYTSESIDIEDISTLRQYVYTSINGFSVRLIDILGLTNTMEDMSASSEQTAQDLAAQQQTRYEDLVSGSAASQTASYSRRKGKTANFSRVKKYVRGA